MSALEEQILTDMAKIAKRKGLEYPFNLILTEDVLTEPDGKLVDIKVEAGYPPTIVIPLIFIGRSILWKKDVILYRDRLERALEKLPGLTRSLSNNINRDSALVLVTDAKRWRRGLADSHFAILDKYFEVEYTVTVREKLSGISQTISGENIREITNEAKARLSRIILNDESLENFRALLEEMTEASKGISASPKSISILTPDVESNQTEEKRSY